MVIIAISIKVYMGWLPALVVATVIVIVAYLFRDPICTIPSAPLAIVSPVSGHIESIEKTSDTYLNRQAIRIRIHMSYLDTHILRSPIEERSETSGQNPVLIMILKNGIPTGYRQMKVMTLYIPLVPETLHPFEYRFTLW